MNKIGLSSACFYPLETEKSFSKALRLGFNNIELFFNSPSELEIGYLQELKSQADAAGVKIISAHPFASFAESYSLFSSYERRFYDYMPLYRSFFEACEFLGIGIFVIHGSKIPGSIGDCEYCERFHRLIEEGQKYSVCVAHENVVKHRCESPQYLKMMRKNIGEDFKVVFDIKQAKRAGEKIDDFLELLGKDIIHVHLSDSNATETCMVPGEGDFDFSALFSKLKDLGYTGDYIIELYNQTFSRDEQLTSAYNYLKRHLNSFVDEKE